MNDESNDTLPMGSPPISSSPRTVPQDTLLQRGVFDPPVVAGTIGKLDRFEILRLIGEGAMGQVYLAREPVTGAQVAIKVMKPQDAEDPQAVHRFLTEARHMYQLSHPRILRVLEVSDRKGGPYYVVPYIAGGNLLKQYTPGKPMSTDRVLTIAGQVAAALAYAHSRGIIHRDLKPGNVLLDAGDNAYLTDFGLVRTVFNDSLVDASASHLEGTAPYMSPAVARGEAEDTRCDIYAFGALLYELLTGQPPYMGRTPQIILDQVLNGPPKPLMEVNPKADPSLVKIAEGCMARELRNRYAAMADVVTDLDRVEEKLAPLGPHRHDGNPRWLRIAAIVAGGLVLVGLAAIVINQFQSQTTQVAGREQQVHPQVDVLHTTTGQSPALPPGLIAWWPADGDAEDVVGHRKGVSVNGADYAPGLVGQAFRVNGKDQYFRVPHDPSLAFPWGADFSLEAWVYRENTTIPFHIMGKRPWAEGNKNCYQMGYDRRGPLAPVKEWTHLVITWSRYETATYMNGTLAGKGIVKQPSSHELNTEDLTIGRAGWCGGFAGLIDDVRIYGRTLSPEEVRALYTTGIANVPAATKTLGGVKAPGTVSPAEQVTTGVDVAPDSPAEDQSVPKATAPPPPPPPPVSTAPAVLTQGPYTYTVADGKATITKYTGPGGKVDIPMKIDGVPVTRIGPSAFENCATLTEVIIPEGITEIADGAFRRCTELAALTIPKSVTTITGNAFNVCTKLTRFEVDATNPAYCSDADGVVFSKDKTTLAIFPCGKSGSYTVPDHVAAIGFAAFAGSSGLTSVTIPRSVTRIGPFAFIECASLTNIRIPDSVTRIDDYSFSSCSSLPEITIPEGVTELGFFSLGNCQGLKMVRIPPSVRSTGPNPFASCGALTDIVVDARNPALCSVKGVLFDKAVMRLVACPAGWAGLYRVPGGVTTIDQFAFRGAGKLTAVVFPPSVNHLAYRAFKYCGNVGGFFFEGNAPGTRSEVFYGCGASTVYYRSGTTGWGKDFGGRPTAIWDPEKPFAYTATKDAVTITRYAHPDEKVTIPAKIDNLPVTTIGPGAFQNCRHVTSIVIPDTVTRIGPKAFEGCVSLTSLKIPDSVVRVEANAFNGCSGLTEVKLPARLLNLEPGVFWGCSALPKITIPEKVIAIADWAFIACTSLTAIEIPASVVTIGRSAFVNCGSLKAIAAKETNPAFSSVDGVLFSKDKTVLVACPGGRTGDYAVPDGVTTIGSSAFEGCAELTKVTVPDGVTSLGDAAFLRCRKLAAVKLSAGLTALYGKTFEGCAELTKVVIPDKVTRIDDRAFAECGKLVEVKLPADLASIGSGAFLGCSSLVAVALPAGVVSIGEAAFQRCPKISEITIPAKVTAIGGEKGNTFTLCQGMTSFKVADGNPAFSTVDGVLFDQAKTRLVCFPAGRKGDYAVPAGTKVMRHAAFESHPGVTSVTIPEGVESIVDYTFIGCQVLETVTLPASVRSIGRKAFSDCAKMTAMYFQGNAPTVDPTAFGGQEKSTVYYRAGTKGWGKEFGGRPTAVWDGKAPPATPAAAK